MRRTGLLGRVWERLREAYEARLLQDAESASRPPRSYLVAAYDPRTRASHVVMRGPRALAVGSWLLRPEVLQFGLPVTAVGALALIVKALGAGTPAQVLPGLFVSLVFAFTAGLWWNTKLGEWIFESRWQRLREEAYDAWTFRLEAARERLRAAAPDERTARRGEELDAVVRLTTPGR